MTLFFSRHVMHTALERCPEDPSTDGPDSRGSITKMDCSSRAMDNNKNEVHVQKISCVYGIEYKC